MTYDEYQMYGESVIQAEFSDQPCQCVKVHSPTPLAVELHHIYPQAEQRKKHGKVVDRELVPLCDIAHKNIHTLLPRLIRGERVSLGNRYQNSILQEGARRIQSGLSVG
jgi:hypothetical protein